MKGVNPFFVKHPGFRKISFTLCHSSQKSQPVSTTFGHNHYRYRPWDHVFGWGCPKIPCLLTWI